MRLLPLDLNGTSRIGYKSLEFDFKAASTEDIKQRVRNDPQEQQKYLASLGEQLPLLRDSVSDEERNLVLKQQIDEVQRSDPAAFAFNTGLSERLAEVDQNLEEIAMMKAYPNMTPDEIWESFKDEGSRYRNHNNLAAGIEYATAGIRLHVQAGRTTKEDYETVEWLRQKLIAFQALPPIGNSERDNDFYQKMLPGQIQNLEQLAADVQANYHKPWQRG